MNLPNSTASQIPWPGRQAAERAFGSFADAVGLKPLRHLAGEMEQLFLAQVEEMTAQAGFMRVVAQAGFDGLRELTERLQLPAAGEAPLTSPMALLRLWFGALDASMHRALLSDAGLAATAATVRASSHRRLHAQRVVSLASDAAGMPSREEVDDAFRELQQLKREVRALKAALAELQPGTALPALADGKAPAVANGKAPAVTNGKSPASGARKAPRRKVHP